MEDNLENHKLQLVARSAHKALFHIFSRVHATLQPALSLCRSVTPSIFFAAPAHPHATKVAVYPALLLF